MGYDTGIADRLRAAGIPMVEVSGWQSRGSSSFSPRGSVNHHTAGGASGATPSLNTVIYGRPDLAGPLANVLQSREPSGDDIAYVVAAGRANHAGSGGWRGLSGNSSVYGLEIEHTGTVPLPEHRQRRAAAIHAAMFGGDPAMVCQHYEWAPTRKIDAAQNVDADAFRQMVAERGGATGGGGDPHAAAKYLLEQSMFVMWGPSGAAICGTGYFKWLSAEEWGYVSTIPNLTQVQYDQRGWDVVRAVCLYGATPSDQNQ